jgi:hypothetical protein
MQFEAWHRSRDVERVLEVSHLTLQFGKTVVVRDLSFGGAWTRAGDSWTECGWQDGHARSSCHPHMRSANVIASSVAKVTAENSALP